MTEYDPRDQALRDDAPEADAAEQRMPVGGEDDQPDWPPQLPLEVDEADAGEQRLVVDLDEDDYR